MGGVWSDVILFGVRLSRQAGLAGLQSALGKSFKSISVCRMEICRTCLACCPNSPM